MGIRKQFSSEFRAKVALEALKGEKTVSALASEFGVHASQINSWRNTLKERLGGVFEGSESKEMREKDDLIERLYKNIGQLQVEVDWFKKKFTV